MPRILPFLAGAGALAAANFRPSHSFLPSIATGFGVPVDSVAALPTATLVGFARGILGAERE